MCWRQRRAASTIEYVAMVLIIMTGLIAMSQYVRNAMQGRYKAAGETFSFGNLDNRAINRKF